MRPRSSDFDTHIRTDHTAVKRARLIRDGKVVQEVTVHGGSVTADRSAANLRTFEIDISDTDLVPEGQASLASPFGTLLQLESGVLIPATDSRQALNNSVNGWSVSGTGVLNGLKDNGSGVLVIGP